MKRFTKSGTFWFAAVAIALLIATIIPSAFFWGWLRSNSETLRNVGLLIGGALAFVFALWRGWIAERQASTAQQSLLNERYQKGAEMLGNEALSVRLGGIYALKHLASEDSEQYHIQIMELLCTFIRHPTMDDDFPEQAEDAEKFLLREDVQAAMRVIGSRGDKHRRLAGKEGYHIDLHGADLRGGNLRGLDLSSPDADMIKSMSAHQAFSNPALRTDLSGARLHGAELFFTDISGVDFSRDGESPATGLTPYQLGLTISRLTEIRWDDENPPTMDGVMDAETGDPLDWNDKPCKD